MDYSKELRKFIEHDFSGLGEFVEIKYDPDSGAICDRCFANVLKVVENRGGERIIGWGFNINPHGFKGLIVAEHHAVWKSPEGELVDISPRGKHAFLNPAINAVPFLPDPSATLIIPEGYSIGIPRPCKCWVFSKAGAKYASLCLNFEKPFQRMYDGGLLELDF